MSSATLLSGPDPRSGPESAASHQARLGPLPPLGAELIGTLERAGLRGRGGAGFPVGRKWRAVAGGRGPKVVLANGAEGEPLSFKDRLLMEWRPHLILDGAMLAAAAVGAGEIILYVGVEHYRAARSLIRALAERPTRETRRIRIEAAPARYVAGEETAAVRQVNQGLALPTSTPPRPFENGVRGRPTLVQNVESLAMAALVARQGDAWYRSSPTTLVTIAGAVRHAGVIETPLGTPLVELVRRSAGVPGRIGAILVGGFFGGWIAADQAWSLALDADSLRAAGGSLGCGVLMALSDRQCGVAETAQILDYLAAQSARQCGPCVFGLAAMAEVLRRAAVGRARPDDLQRLERWSSELPGRGACRHPDGAAGLVRSALRVFAEDFDAHLRGRDCAAAERLDAGVA